MNSIRPLGWSIFRLLAETACSGGYSPGRTERDDHVQVCTFKSSASVIHHGRAVRLSGKVPGTGKVIIYARTKAAGQPSTTAAKGWAKAGTYTIRSGKFVTGLLHPKRSTWYVARYRGYDFTAFTSVIKVRVH